MNKINKIGKRRNTNQPDNLSAQTRNSDSHNQTNQKPIIKSSLGSLLFFGGIVATVTAYFMRPLHRPRLGQAVWSQASMGLPMI